MTIQWTAKAKEQLADLPQKVRDGILDKAGALATCDDPAAAHKPLTGPLMGYYRLTYGRYRAIYSVDEDELPSGDMLVHCRILFVAVGQRKEHDRRDVYKIAKSLIDMGVIPPDPPTA